MNLIYVWNEDYLNKEKYRQTGFCLSSKYDVKYDINEMELSIIKNHSYVPNFWGENIFDVMAVVGDNGSGKTMLLNYLMDIIYWISSRGEVSEIEFFAVFEDEEDDKFIVMATPQFYNMNNKQDVNVQIEKVGDISNDILMVYKFGYFTNALSLTDYQYAKNGCTYDASLGGLIANDSKKAYEMHQKELNDDNILNYYGCQFLRVIKFIYSDEIKEFDIPFTLPKKIDIYLNKSSANEEYIYSELEKMKSHNEELDKILSKRKFRFNFYFQPIRRQYSNTWICGLLINLIVNLFREICISVIAGQHRNEETVSFINVLESFEAKVDREESIFKEFQNLIVKIKDISSDYQLYQPCERYQEFISWIENNEKYFKTQYSNSYERCCSIPLDKEHEQFIMGLLYHYEKTRFYYPYFTFRLGLSTGELNFLNIFANLYNMSRENKTGNSIITNPLFSPPVCCTNILLAFDEADLSLHPKWQQKYLYWLLEFIKSAIPVCQVHIIIATHSPIMLSDFPNENVLYLDDKYADIKRDVKTFGSNIHDLFLDSFFLSNKGTIGEFAEQKIKEIVKQLNNEELGDAEKENILKIIYSVGDDVVRNKLLQLYNQKANKYIAQEKKVEDSDTIDMTINLLKMQKEQIERMIIELEKKKK